MGFRSRLLASKLLRIQCYGPEEALGISLVCGIFLSKQSDTGIILNTAMTCLTRISFR